MAEPTKRKKWSDVKVRLRHEAYFNALQIRLDAVAKEFDTLPADVRAQVRVRLGRIQMRAQAVGWGFSDAVEDVIHALDARVVRVRPGQANRR